MTTKKELFDQVVTIAEKAIDMAIEERENNKRLWKGIETRDKEIRDLEMKLDMADGDYREALNKIDAYKNEIMTYELPDERMKR